MGYHSSHDADVNNRHLKSSFRTWKSGKHWLYASSALLILGAVGASPIGQTIIKTIQTQVVHAEALTSAVTITPDNMGQYFNSIGSATAPSDGTVQLTPNTNNQAGSTVLNTQISLDSSFVLKGAINLGTTPQTKGGADGIGFNFTPTATVGNYGNGFGLGGIPNSVGFKFDTYYNSSVDNTANAAADPAIVGVTEPAKNTAGGKGYSFGTFDATNASGQISSTTSSSSATANPKRIGDPNGKFNNVEFDYDGTTHVMTVTYTDPTYGTMTWSEDITSYVNSLKAANNGSASTYFSISASTGGSKNQQQFTLSQMQYYQPVAIEGKNSTIVTGSTWKASDNLTTVTDSSGNPVPANDKNLTVSVTPATGTNAPQNPNTQNGTTVDTNTPGNYNVTYTYTDPATGEAATTTVIVTVKAPPVINVENSTINEGSTWTQVDNFVDGTNSSNTAINGNDSSLTTAVTGPNGYTGTTVDTSVPGDYTVVYTYNDANGESTSDTAVVTVLAKPTISSKDSTIFQGDTWSPADNFTGGTDSMGNPITWGEVGLSITSVVGPNGSALSLNSSTPAGVYKVTYQFTDPKTGAITTTVATVTIGAPYVEAQDTQIMPNNDGTTPTWSPADNFVSVTTGAAQTITDYNAATTAGVQVTQILDPDGNKVPTVDTSKPGNYSVTYSYTATITLADGSTEEKTVSDTGIVTVYGPVSATANDSTINVGSTWSPADNLGDVTNSEGGQVPWGDPELTVSVLSPDGSTGTSVDTNKAGIYKVTYTYTDPDTGDLATATATVTVKDNTAISSVKKDSILEGNDYQPATDFTSSTNADASAGSVTDTNDAKVNVVITDSTGKTVWTGTADESVPADKLPAGDYTVTYSVKDSNGNPVTSTTALTVTADKTTLTTKTTDTINAGNYNPETDYTSSTNIDGSSGTLSSTNNKPVQVKVTNQNGDVIYTGDANHTLNLTGGSYTVVYTVDNGSGTAVTSTTLVTVKDNTAINSKATDTLKVGQSYSPASDFVSSVNADASAGSLTNTNGAEVAVVIKDSTGKTIWTGTADETVPAGVLTGGSYNVTYTVKDSNGNPVSATTTLVSQDLTAISSKATDELTPETGQTTVNFTPSTDFTASSNADGSAGSFDNTNNAAVKVTVTDTSGNAVKANSNGSYTLAQGNYTVVYSTTDSNGNAVSSTTELTVAQAPKDNTALTSKATDNTTVGAYNPATDLTVATNADGSDGLASLTVNSATIHATITNNKGNVVYDGDVSGSVNLTGGSYNVTYTAKDKSGNTVTATTIVNVADNTALSSKPNDSLNAGSTFNPTTDLTTMTNADGSAGNSDKLNGKAVQVVVTDSSGKVVTPDASGNYSFTGGNYTVTYTTMDSNGNAVTSTTLLTVTDNTALTTKTTDNITVGDDFKPANDFTSSVNANGSAGSLTDTNGQNITVSITDKDGKVIWSGNADDTVPASKLAQGSYTVTYSTKNSNGNLISQSTLLTVNQKDVVAPTDKTALVTKPNDSLAVGKDFKPADDFTGSINADGSAGSLTDTNGAKIKVTISDENGKIVWTGTSDETVPAAVLPVGNYTVTYTVQNAAGNDITSTTHLTVDAGEIISTPPMIPTPAPKPTPKPIAKKATNKPTAQKKVATVSKHQSLPATGENENNSLVLIGSLSLVGVALLEAWKQRNYKSKHSK
ncbi:bacterial Ig-like domain-containing protein [Lactococcus nasutitermitis]|uniref:Bacterial Ig-like domain-containing protein n=1 Tax=Lactococcus nasutitermitis TaxID=1652957 RepID=A0ABV9JFV9_9LACT|nr:bacterial Ig-like domain-containing protein [Lactococcus nasutitermitis]